MCVGWEVGGGRCVGCVCGGGGGGGGGGVCVCESWSLCVVVCVCVVVVVCVGERREEEGVGWRVGWHAENPCV